eukprot:m.331587 g.331587  ORF g.331587 m.331587 type:complete len:297 (-) comp16757_c0_seq1:84-974(-)
MCFTGEMSGGFALFGLVMCAYVYRLTGNLQLTVGIFYFFLMEALQYFQYWYIDDCKNPMNRFLTLVGFAHICYQPYFTHVLNSALCRSKTTLTMYVAILRLTLIGGTLLYLRYVFSDTATQHFAPISRIDMKTGQAMLANETVSTEWLRGEELCTVSGKYHLAWVVPMSDVSYYTQSSAIHSFLMFAPFCVVKINNVIQGLFLFAFGPALASYITPNLMEQASIWCFFSIAQIFVMVLIITNIVTGGRASTKDNRPAPYMDLRFIWPMGVVEPAAKAEKKTASEKADLAAGKCHVS